MAHIRLAPMSLASAKAIERGEAPPDVPTAPDYPTEFSRGVAATAASGSVLGPYLILEGPEGVAVGEIGGALISAGTVEIGYAVVRSRWGQGVATAAVEALVALLEPLPGVDKVVAHTPLTRPESGRVVEKAGFTCAGERDDESDGAKIRVKRWERQVGRGS